MNRDWNQSEALSAKTAPTQATERSQPITNWVELGRAILAEASHRTTQELIARRCGKLQRAVQVPLRGGAV